MKFVCVNADVEGYTLDASMLGGEYSLVLHENGTTDFVMVGTAVPGVLWSMGENGNVLLDYYGTIMELVWMDTSFDLNCFDTMLMHFAAQG